MFSRLILLMFGLSLIAGCAKRPQVELEIVRAEVAKAYTNGAKVLAAKDYAAAAAALKEAEDLVYQGQYGQAHEVLNRALLSAAKAAELAQVKSVELESQRLRKEKILAAKRKRITAIAKVKPPIVTKPKARAVKKPAPKPAIVLLDQVTVSVGETLFSLSSRSDIYGEPLLWPLIYKANRDQIKDPQQIFEGQVLIIPRDKDKQEKESARKEARESELFPR